MSALDTRPMSMQFLLRWNRIFYWIFLLSYTLSTVMFALGGNQFGFSEYLRIFTVGVVGVALALSYMYRRVYAMMHKISYFIVFLILANTTALAYNNPTSPLALVYMGSSTMILTYMYLDMWYLIAYQVVAIAAVAAVTFHAYGNQLKPAIIAAVIELLLMFYVTVFMRVRKIADDELDAEVVARRKEHSLRLDAEKKLVEVSKHYRDIVDVAPYQIATMDTSCRYTYVNNAVSMNEQLRLWIIGKTDREYVSVHGGDKELPGRIEEAVAKCIETGEAYMMDVSFNSDDKLKIPFQRKKVFVPIKGSSGSVEKIAVYG